MDSLTQFFAYFSPFGGTFTKSSTKSKKEEQFKQQNFRRGEGGQNGAVPPGRGGEMAVDKAKLVAKRATMLSSKCQTFYADDPLLVARASMQFVFDENGRRFLDCISNVQHVGHCHPRVVEAVHSQLSLSTCNIRFLSPILTDLAESLLQTFPSQLDTVLFCNSGSEANDLALQLARDWTGAKDVIVLENAYHGHLTTAMQMSPYKFDRGSNIKQPKWVHVGPAPDLYRGKYRHADEDFGDKSELSRKYVEDIRRILERAKAKGRRVAAFIAEALQSCGGQVLPPRGYFRQVAETGFGRVGDTFWAHQLDGEDGEFVPDIVTMGKSMGNGYPIAAVVTCKEIADKHCGAVSYFNTYGGNPASCAAALSVLRVIREENLLGHCQNMGELFRKELNGLKERHKSVGDVRGAGMFWGVDLVKSRCTREPNSELAHKLILKLKREDGVLLSIDGPYGNILKFKPPLCFGVTDLREAINALDKALGELSNDDV
uniref:Uncharacterized protein n=1 Tax=Globodera rostochiensis TaxID=31243 RepID=A0A914HZ59_GLORO